MSLSKGVATSSSLTTPKVDSVIDAAEKRVAANRLRSRKQPTRLAASAPSPPAAGTECADFFTNNEGDGIQSIGVPKVDTNSSKLRFLSIDRVVDFLGKIQNVELQDRAKVKWWRRKLGLTSKRPESKSPDTLSNSLSVWSCCCKSTAAEPEAPIDAEEQRISQPISTSYDVNDSRREIDRIKGDGGDEIDSSKRRRPASCSFPEPASNGVKLEHSKSVLSHYNV